MFNDFSKYDTKQVYCKQRVRKRKTDLKRYILHEQTKGFESLRIMIIHITLKMS